MKASDTPPDAVAEAVAAISTAAELQVTAGGAPGAELPPVILDRLSVDRRVLGHITAEVDKSTLGPRNTLAAIYDAVSTDRNTTNPAGGNPRLDLDGLSIEESVSKVRDILQDLVGHGLVEHREDGSYELTDAGHLELAS